MSFAGMVLVLPCWGHTYNIYSMLPSRPTRGSRSSSGSSGRLWAKESRLSSGLNGIRFGLWRPACRSPYFISMARPTVSACGRKTWLIRRKTRQGQGVTRRSRPRSQASYACSAPRSSRSSLSPATGDTSYTSTLRRPWLTGWRRCVALQEPGGRIRASFARSRARSPLVRSWSCCWMRSAAGRRCCSGG